MLARVTELADELRLSKAELLSIAREAAEDGALLSVAHLRTSERGALIGVLEQIRQDRAYLNSLEFELVVR